MYREKCLLTGWGTYVTSVCLLWRTPFGFRFLWVHGEMPHGKLLVSYRVTRDNTTTSRMDHSRVKTFYIADNKSFLAVTHHACEVWKHVCFQQEPPSIDLQSLHLSCHQKLRLAAQWHPFQAKFCSKVKSCLKRMTDCRILLEIWFFSCEWVNNSLVSRAFERPAHYKAHRGHLWQWERIKLFVWWTLIPTISYVVKATKNKNESCSIVIVFLCALAFVAKCEVIVVTRWQERLERLSWKVWLVLLWVEFSLSLEVLYLKEKQHVSNWAAFMGSTGLHFLCSRIRSKKIVSLLKYQTCSGQYLKVPCLISSAKYQTCVFPALDVQIHFAHIIKASFPWQQERMLRH